MSSFRSGCLPGPRDRPGGGDRPARRYLHHAPPPHVNGFHLYLPGDPDTLRSRHLELAAATGDGLFGTIAATAAHGQSVVEIQVDDATGDFMDADIVEQIAQLIGR
jgi:hypothetical protein